MKIDRHGQARLLSAAEIELLFRQGLQTDRDRTIFGVCLYTGCRISEACSLVHKDVYKENGIVRPSINIRKGNTKGKLGTRTIPVNKNLRSLLEIWYPNAGATFLFPGGCKSCSPWKHITSDGAAYILRTAFARIGIEGASTHSFRRTALTQMNTCGIPLRVIQEISGHHRLEALQRYLVVNQEQVTEAIGSLSTFFSPTESR